MRQRPTALTHHTTRHCSLLVTQTATRQPATPHIRFGRHVHTLTAEHSAHSDTATIDAMAALNTQSPSPEHDRMVSVLTRHRANRVAVAAPPSPPPQRFSPRAVLTARCIASALLIPPAPQLLPRILRAGRERAESVKCPAHARAHRSGTHGHSRRTSGQGSGSSLDQLCPCVVSVPRCVTQPRASTRPPSHFDCWISRWCSCICRRTG